jgi:hypothetical protein
VNDDLGKHESKRSMSILNLCHGKTEENHESYVKVAGL